MSDFLKDYAREPVPVDKRRSWYSFSLVWIAVIVCVPVFLMGGQMGNSLSLPDVLLVVMGAGICMCVIAYPISLVANSCHLATGQILRITFGNRGSQIAAFILAAGSFGWFGIQLEFFSKGIHLALIEVLDVDISEKLIIIIGGILMTITGAIGYKAIEKLSFLSIPVMLLVIIWPIFSLSEHSEWQNILVSAPPEPLSMGIIAGMYIGGFSAGLAVAPDMFRYIRNWKHSVIGLSVAVLLFAPFIFSLFAFYTRLTGEGDIFSVFMVLGLGLPAIIMVALSAWTTNDSNLYSASLNFSAIFTRWPKWQIASVVGALGTVLALFGILSQFMSFLLFIGIVMMPITATYITDYFFHKELYKTFTVQTFRFKNWIGLFVGFIVGVSTLPLDQNGLGLMSLSTVPPIDGFIATVITLIFINIFWKEKNATIPA